MLGDDCSKLKSTARPRLGAPLANGRGGPPSRPPPVGFGAAVRQSQTYLVHAAWMAGVANINDVLEGHVALEIECVDRLYLNAYLPCLQVGGQLIRFLCGHLGNPIASSALLTPIGNRFRREVKAFAAERGIPILELKKPDRSRWDDRKLDHIRPHFERAEREGRYGVVAIVSCQEYQWVFSGRNRQKKPGARPNFEFFKEDRRVGIYYFYILDPESARVSSSSARTVRGRERSGSTATSESNAKQSATESTTSNWRTVRCRLRPRAAAGDLRQLLARARAGVL